MIDLKELERRLDEALANETSESLIDWLFDQRRDNLVNFLGKGCIEEFKGKPYTFNQKNTPVVQFKVILENIPGNQFSNAA